ncbi:MULTISPECIES: tyrosine-type recombinase/integrase [unclassified Undibacterium]|uniref:tyrosine-type recombinase/integrase n=1 Tax=unclassified Undibacterium TaxID=2630295 RepID=UPI003C2E6C1A
MDTLPALRSDSTSPALAQSSHPPLPPPLILARNDREIIDAWLSRPGLSNATVKNLRKDAGRFLLWIESRGLGLRDVRFEDLIAYSEFVMNPQPADLWISTAKWPRHDPRWRPFSGPLSDASHKKTLETIKSLFSWCALARYLEVNPAVLLGRISAPRRSSVERYLPAEGIGLLLDACDGRPQESWRDILKVARSRFLIHVYYGTGARLHEISSATMDSFRPDHKGMWWLHVMGKGGIEGSIPVSLDLLSEFKRYRSAFGLPPLPKPGDTTPLILPVTGAVRPVADCSIHREVKAVMTDAARLAELAGDDRLSIALASASTHWLRHSAITHQLDAGASLKTVQKNARHSSITTTSLYIHKTDDDRHAETVAAQKKAR